MSLEIDTIISELDNVLHYRGEGGLVAAAARAPELLKQKRYDLVNDARESLAEDITAAIAVLPKDVRDAAKGILPIDYPTEYLIGRLRKLGIGGYSTAAVSWHRTAVLGRVATGLLGLYSDASPNDAQPSYRLQAIDIKVSNHALKAPLRTLSRAEYRRHIEFSWTIDCLVSDLRMFAFSVTTTKGLEFSRLVPGQAGPECQSAERVPYANRADTHWHILFLTDALPTDVPVTLACVLEYTGGPDQAPPQFDFIPDTDAKRLSLSLETNGEQGAVPCKCEAWDQAAGIKTARRIDTLTPKEYKSRITSRQEPGALGPWDEWVETLFRVPRPKAGRRYSLTWDETS